MVAQIFNMVIGLAMFVIFLRFMLQFAGMGPHNPYIKPAYDATQVVDLFSRIFPNVGNGRISLAAIVILFLFKLIEISGNASMASPPESLTPLFLVGSGVFGLILDFFSACQYLIFGVIIVSWVVVLTNSMHPILAIIMQLGEPILAPFRRIVPNLGPLDLSAIVALFTFMIMSEGVVQVAKHILPQVA